MIIAVAGAMITVVGVMITHREWVVVVGEMTTWVVVAGERIIMVEVAGETITLVEVGAEVEVDLGVLMSMLEVEVGLDAGHVV